MTKDQIKEKLKKLKKAEHRKNLLEARVYDGRYRQRVITDKRFKKPKHKKRIFDDF